MAGSLSGMKLTAVPEPMAMPMSARRRAGASFTPSPVIATTCPCGDSGILSLHDRPARAKGAQPVVSARQQTGCVRQMARKGPRHMHLAIMLADFKQKRCDVC